MSRDNLGAYVVAKCVSQSGTITMDQRVGRRERIGFGNLELCRMSAGNDALM